MENSKKLNINFEVLKYSSFWQSLKSELAVCLPSPNEDAGMKAAWYNDDELGPYFNSSTAAGVNRVPFPHWQFVVKSQVLELP